MGIVKLNKIQIFGAKKQQDILLEELQKSGILEIRKQELEVHQKIKVESEQYLNRLSFLLSILEQKSQLGFLAQNKIQYISEEEFFQTQKSILQDNYQLIDRIDQIYQDILLHKTQIHDLITQIEYLENLKDCNITTNHITETRYLKSFFGFIPHAKLPYITELAMYNNFSVDELLTYQNKSYILVVSYKDSTLETLDFLKDSEFEDMQKLIPKIGSIKQHYHLLSDALTQNQSRLLELEYQFAEFLNKLPQLQIFFDYLSNKVEKDLVQFDVEEHQFFFTFQSYIPTRQLSQLDYVLTNFSSCSYELIDIDENETLPVLIDNKWSKPFEFVSDMYSRPGNKDLDPTPLFAPFFAIFMGVAIGDAGVGLCLVLLSLAARKFLRLNESTKNLLGVCVYGGFMAIVVGVLTATYFAIPLEHMNIHIPYLYKPEVDIMMALGISFGLGFIHITFAYFIRFFHLLGKKDIFGALADGLTHIVIMLGGLAIILGIQFPNLAYLVPISSYILYADVLVIWLTSGRHYSETFLGRILWGFYGVYELTSIVGDILSYARLFALGLAGGIIASAINELTPQLLNSISFDSVGGIIYSLLMIVIFLTILIIGHIFAAILAILGAFIHTMRLQFVEFFGKFFNGGGVAFSPLRIRSKYYWINKKITKKP